MKNVHECIIISFVYIAYLNITILLTTPLDFLPNIQKPSLTTTKNCTEECTPSTGFSLRKGWPPIKLTPKNLLFMQIYLDQLVTIGQNTFSKLYRSLWCLYVYMAFMHCICKSTMLAKKLLVKVMQNLIEFGCSISSVCIQYLST